MNKSLPLLLVAILLNGCVASQIVPPSDLVRRYEHFVVVAIEPPPLIVPPALATSVLEPTMHIAIFSYPLAIVGGIVLLTQLPEAAKRTARYADSLDKALTSEEVWIPTIALANEVANQVSSSTLRTATVRPVVSPLPGVHKRERTWNMENWYAPIRAWYNNTSSLFQYQEILSEKADAVLEVGLLNYEIGPGNLFLIQVMIKLVDPVTGKVMGRSREGACPRINNIDSILLDNGRVLKEAFMATSRELITKNLKELGLLPQ